MNKPLLKDPKFYTEDPLVFLLCDAYKTGHINQQPLGTDSFFENLTARSHTYFNTPLDFDGSVFMGLQRLVLRWLVGSFDNFFKTPFNQVEAEYLEYMDGVLGKGVVKSAHLKELHELGYIPLEIRAVPEGSLVPIRVPFLTIENTVDGFGWLTGYFEDLWSNELWKPCVLATKALHFRRVLEQYANETGAAQAFIDYQAHNFALRGMSGMFDDANSSVGQLIYFKGSDSFPSVWTANRFYNPGGDVSVSEIANSVPATEHSVTCLNIAVYAEELKATPEYANVTEAELLSKAEELFQRRLITEVYPSGVFSFVSDTNDFFDTITTKAIANKDAIMARDGKLVYRPDCYSSDTSILTPKGWKLFSELTDDDLVAQVLDDNSYEFVKPLKIINQEYKGPMHHFHDFHGKVDLLVTPNHRMVLSQKNPISGDWNERIVYAEKLGPEGNHLQRMYRSAKSKSTGKKITPLERLKIAFQADGSFLSKGDHSIRFSFAKPRKIDRLIRLADEAGIATSVYKLKDGRFEIHLKIDRSNFSKDFDWVDTSDLCSDWANGFIDELKYWDSSIRSDRRFKYDTTNPKIVPVVELIAIAAGKGVFINRYSDERKEIFSDVYSMHIVECNVVTGQGWKKDIVEYDGTVHCVTVPSGKVLVKRNRCILVSGNSGQPYHILCGYTWDGDNHLSKGVKPDPRIEGENLYSETEYADTKRFPRRYAEENGFEAYCVDNVFYSVKDDRVLSIEEVKGAVRILSEIFGYTVNAAGYKESDPHVGLIYGDAININTMTRILSRLKENGFCSSNVVFGVGSFEFQFVTRDTLGIAMKATAGKVNGKHYNIAKNPKTDDGTKKSAKGYLIVYREDDGTLTLKDDLTREQYETLRGSERDAMRTVYLNGDVKILESIRTIRERAAQWI